MTMANQLFSIEQLSTLAAASPTALPASILVDTLANHEAQIAMLFTDRNTSGDVGLISSFYTSYLLALLLVDDMYVHKVCTATGQLLTNTAYRNEARFLIQRFPPTLSDTDQVLVNTKRLLRAVWSRQYPSIYQALQQSQWPDLLKPLASRYLGRSPTSEMNPPPRL